MTLAPVESPYYDDRMARRKKPGPKPSGKARRPVSIRLSADEFSIIEAAAAHEGAAVTEFIREAALRSARRVTR